jgi:hemolysin D
MGEFLKPVASTRQTGMKGLSSLFRSPQEAHTSPNEFAPDILRIQATPPRPMPRAVLGIGLTLLGVALLWSAFGRLDIVAVAQGKLVPQSSLKIVQPAEAGIVNDILVQEGQLVKAGQTLMRMDPTLALADLRALRTELQHKSMALRRVDAELSGQPFLAEPNDPQQLFGEAQAQYLANRGAQDAAIAQERATWERSKQEMSAALETRNKLAQTLPHYRNQDEAFQKLVKEGFTGRIMADDKARERIEKEQDYRSQAFVVAREQANMALSEKKIAQLQTDYLRRLRTERAELSDRVQHLQQEVAKQSHRHALLELKAPQDGRVKDLATHTVGTVAQPGTILMTLVPIKESLLAEVWLSNEDVGFVRPGQPVKLKLTAFQFQKYGMLDAHVEQVAADATDRQEAGADPSKQAAPLAYRTSVSLDRQVLKVDALSYRLASGMQVSAEIKLGERTVLEYLLSPVQKAFHEAGRER